MKALRELVLAFFECKDVTTRDFWAIFDFGHSFLDKKPSSTSTYISGDKKLVKFEGKLQPEKQGDYHPLEGSDKSL